MESERPHPIESPRVWVLKSQRVGENTQLNALADALGWGYQIKQIEYRSGIPYFLLGSSLLGIKKEQSELAEPWPDLVISASAKNEPVARWIRDNAGKSVCLIILGRPWAKLKYFDLIVTTPQYRLPQKHNVHTNTVPMHYPLNSQLDIKKTRYWGDQLSHLPKPYIVLMVGGHSGPYTFDKRAMQRLVFQINQMTERIGGSLLVSTSARTPEKVADYLEANLSVPKYLHRWALSNENPYYAFLGLAESIVVTGDSISMLSEACAMLKPVYIFDLGEGPVSMRSKNYFSLACLKYFFAEGFAHFEIDYLRNIVYRLAMWIGPARLSRDLNLVHQRLIDENRTQWLGEEFNYNSEKRAFQDVSETVDIIKRLMDTSPLSVAPVNGQ